MNVMHAEVPRKILLMEDEDSVAKGLQMVLHEEGYLVDWSTTGKGALDKFSRKPFDLLMADLRLPDIDGMDVIRQVKRHWPDTVIIVITGYASVSSAVDAMKLGAFDYLAKPFTEDEIKSVVEGAFRAKGKAPILAESETAEQGRRDEAEASVLYSGDRRPRILLMEDETSVAQGLQWVLAETGYDIDVVPSGRKAMDRIRQNGFDVLIADLRLPDMDGMEVIRQIKDKDPDMGIVAITGYPSVSTAVDAMKLGVSEYLPKPFSADEVKAAVKEALRVRESARIRELIETVDSEKGKLIQKREVIRILDRAAQDARFWQALLERGSEALGGYVLSTEAKAAIISGDLNWIVKHVGELTDAQLQWIRSRLELERW